MGAVSASELMRSLLSSDRPSTLARAIADLGRIPKTINNKSQEQESLINVVHNPSIYVTL
jgi:TnpA family transposase